MPFSRIEPCISMIGFYNAGISVDIFVCVFHSPNSLHMRPCLEVASLVMWVVGCGSTLCIYQNALYAMLIIVLLMMLLFSTLALVGT